MRLYLCAPEEDIDDEHDLPFQRYLMPDAYDIFQAALAGCDAAT